MAVYRVYYGDHSGRVFSTDDLEAKNDQVAIGNAMQKGRSLVVEVWQDDRLVLQHPSGASLTGNRPPHLATSLR